MVFLMVMQCLEVTLIIYGSKKPNYFTYDGEDGYKRIRYVKSSSFDLILNNRPTLCSTSVHSSCLQFAHFASVFSLINASLFTIDSLGQRNKYHQEKRRNLNLKAAIHWMVPLRWSRDCLLRMELLRTLLISRKCHQVQLTYLIVAAKMKISRWEITRSKRRMR